MKRKVKEAAVPELGLPLFEAFLEGLGIPDSCVLNKPLFKKMFQEHTDLDAKDKQALKSDVDKIRWLYTLKPSTINIAPFSDDVREYGEIAVLSVELSNVKQVERIGHLINRAIPYPVVIFFCHRNGLLQADTEEQGSSEQLAVCLADKRTNKADKDKWVIEELQVSPWISLSSIASANQAFLTSLKLTGLPHSNFWQLYQALLDRVLALQCAAISGRFRLLSSQTDNEAHKVNQRLQLQRYHQVVQNIKKLRAKIKQSEFSQQVILNTEIKLQEQQLKKIAEDL
jgi:hypothetical protein